jgi:Transcriptional regulators of sugar metabolism
MLSEKRFFEILKIVNDKKSVTVQELTELLNTSESTIRRDLTVLHNEGKLKKVHGGATAIGMNYYMKDDEVAYRQDLNMEEKRRIAKYAASLIRENDFVYMDAGTTTELMIDYIEAQNVIFVTNATVHAKKLVQKGYQTFILGGELKLATEAVVGSEAVLGLQKYNFTKGFWGTNGVSKTMGFTTPDLNEAFVKQKSMERCKERYVLCDSSKFNQIAPATFAEFDSAYIITTRLEEENFLKSINILEVGKE